MTNICSRLKNYFTETNHPIVQIFYIFIGPVCYVLFFKFVYLDKFHIVEIIPFILGNLFAFLGFLNYYKAWRTDPGVVHKDNHKELVEKYKPYYDGITFVENVDCKTCKIPK
jgi:hypothetical protein